MGGISTSDHRPTLAAHVAESRANRTLLPAAPTGVAMAPRTTGFGDRDRFELNGKIGLHRAAG
jgi:hypothetical protein